MKRALSYVTFLDMIFISLIAISGIFTGILKELFYYLAFILPVAMAYPLKKDNSAHFTPPSFSLSRRSFGFTLLSLPLILALIFGASFLTSLILSLFSENRVTDVSGNIILVIFKNAFLVAVLEEALFRYVPIAFLKPYTKKGAIIFSAAFFALSHCNLYQIPYAFLAGVIFAAIDIAADSIWPSVIIHFFNNAASVIWLRLSGVGSFAVIYIFVLIASAVVSAALLFILFRGRKERIYELFRDGKRLEISYGPILFAAMTLLIATLSL